MLVKQYIISIVLLLYSCEKNDVAPWGVKRGVKNEANADC